MPADAAGFSADSVVAELIAQREEEEALQREAEERLAAEQAARAEEDARLRELYPLPEDEEDYGLEDTEQEQSAESDMASTAAEDNDATEFEHDVAESTDETGGDGESVIENDEDGTR